MPPPLRTASCALEGRGFVVREVDHNQNAEVIFATQAGRDAFDA
jgi:hypothetical protein